MPGGGLSCFSPEQGRLGARYSWASLSTPGSVVASPGRAEGSQLVPPSLWRSERWIQSLARSVSGPAGTRLTAVPWLVRAHAQTPTRPPGSGPSLPDAGRSAPARRQRPWAHARCVASRGRDLKPSRHDSWTPWPLLEHQSINVVLVGPSWLGSLRRDITCFPC